MAWKESPAGGSRPTVFRLHLLKSAVRHGKIHDTSTLMYRNHAFLPFPGGLEDRYSSHLRS